MILLVFFLLQVCFVMDLTITGDYVTQDPGLEGQDINSCIAKNTHHKKEEGLDQKGPDMGLQNVGHQEINGRADKEEVCKWVDDGNDEEEERISFGLVGKLWSERTLNPTAFMSNIKNVWAAQHGVDINMIGKNLYQFQFYHWRDKERVLKGQPWHFDKVAILLIEMNEAQRPLDIQFFSLPIWVRVYNLPFRGRYNEINARTMGDKIGEFMEMDRSAHLGMEKSLRIRVSIDVRKPLKKNVPIKIRAN